MKNIIFLLPLIIISTSCERNSRFTELENSIQQLRDSITVLNTKIRSTQLINESYTKNKNFTYLGVDAGKYNRSSENVFVGNSAGATSKVRNSVLVGIDSGVNSRGYGNVAIGNYSGQNINGDNNTLIGKAVANQKIGNNNIVIGTHAGQKLGYFSDKLVIESSDSSLPLIFGDFKKDYLLINGKLNLNSLLQINPSTSIPKLPKEGTIYYDKTLKVLRYWNGTKWIDIK